MPYKAKQRLVYNTVDELTMSAKTHGIFERTHFVLGGGTNTVFVRDFDGDIISFTNKNVSTAQDNEFNYIEVGAGHDWHRLVLFLMNNGIYGLENLALIPGSVGAAPIQNIGAYGVEFSDVCDYVEFIDKRTLTLERLSAKELNLSYRDSIFKHELKNRAVITKVGIKLRKSYQPINTYKGLSGLQTPKDIYAAVISERQQKLPDHLIIPNAGSFFKNPILDNEVLDNLKASCPNLPIYPVNDNQSKTSAAWLIEQAGWKGKRLGGVAIYKNHALILINDQQGNGEQLIEIVAALKAAVTSQFGIALEPEVQMIGV